MQSLISLILSLVPWSGYRTYAAAALAVVIGASMIWAGDYANGAELALIGIMFFFKRASDDKLMAALNKVVVKEPEFPTHKYPGGPE